MNIRNFFFDLVLLGVAMIIIPRALYIRFNRKAFFKKYKLKPGVPGYKKFTIMTDARVLSVAFVLTGLIIVKTVLDILNIVHGRHGVVIVWTIAGFVAAILVGVTLAVYNMTRDE